MELLEFITAYRWQILIVFFVATVMFQIGVKLQKKYKWAQNGRFACSYMLVNMYIPFFLFLLLIK